MAFVPVRMPIPSFMSRVITVRVQAILGLASLRAQDTVARVFAGHVQGTALLSILTDLLLSMSLLTVIVSFQALHFAVA